MMTDCADCKFYQDEANRLQKAVMKAATSGVDSEDIQELRDNYLMALDELNEHQVLAHGVRWRPR